MRLKKGLLPFDRCRCMRFWSASHYISFTHKPCINSFAAHIEELNYDVSVKQEQGRRSSLTNVFLISWRYLSIQSDDDDAPISPIAFSICCPVLCLAFRFVRSIRDERSYTAIAVVHDRNTNFCMRNGLGERETRLLPLECHFSTSWASHA